MNVVAMRKRDGCFCFLRWSRHPASGLHRDLEVTLNLLRPVVSECEEIRCVFQGGGGIAFSLLEAHCPPTPLLFPAFPLGCFAVPAATDWGGGRAVLRQQLPGGPGRHGCGAGLAALAGGADRGDLPTPPEPGLGENHLLTGPGRTVSRDGIACVRGGGGWKWLGFPAEGMGALIFNFCAPFFLQRQPLVYGDFGRKGIGFRIVSKGMSQPIRRSRHLSPMCYYSISISFVTGVLADIGSRQDVLLVARWCRLHE